MLASAPDSRAELTLGTSYCPPPAFGRFKLLHQIGAGVLGPVFRTHDPDHEHLVAVKAFTLDLTPEQASVLSAEFSRIADLAFDSPCVAGPVAAGVEDFVPYAAAPYVSGESLDAAIRQYGPAPVGDAIRLIGHVAEALDAAARLGVFHGSLHPRDIIVTPGETHVTGFGVAQALGRVGLHGPIRRPYVAPERESGDAWGAAADIYSLAAIAYEVLTGRRALPGTDQPLPALNDLRVHDGAALRDALESAFDPDPARRPGCAGDFAAAFAAALSDGVAAGAAGERAVERRPRKPRTRAPKLPGLDEPLRSPERAISERPLPSVAETGTAAPAGDGIHYVPVNDPADAGEAAPEPEALQAAPPGEPLDLAAEPASDSAAAVVSPPFAPFEPGMLVGPTPDLRPGNDLLPRGDAAGETVDAELAAALDRLSPDSGSGPTPAVLGLDIFGPGPAAEPNRDENIAADAPRADPAADTELAYRVMRRPPLQVSGVDAVEKPAQESESDDFALDFMALETPAARPDAAGEAGAATPEPERKDDAAPEEPLRPFVRGRSAERRRTSSRYGRGDALTPSSAGPEVSEPEIPRAFEPDRPTFGARPVSDFELMARADASRPLVVPVVAGLVAGLIIGLAGGYWLGSRNAPPASAPATQVSTPVRPDPEASRPAAVPPAAPAGGETAARPVEGTPSAAPLAASPRPSAPAPAAPPAPADRGSLQITASPQANVYLDGERRGMTPRNLNRVPLGSHTIRVTRSGYAQQEQTVVLTAEEPSARLAFTLRRGSPAAPTAAPTSPRSVLTVLIESTPSGARISIDGRDLGPTPLTVRQLRPGTHTLELRMPAFRLWSQRLTVAAGDSRKIMATLEREPAR
jgi:hypothetical protein